MRALAAAVMHLLFLNEAWGETTVRRLTITPNELPKVINSALSQMNINDKFRLLGCPAPNNGNDDYTCLYQLGDYIQGSILVPKGSERPNILFLNCTAQENTSKDKCLKAWLAAMIALAPDGNREHIREEDWNSPTNSIFTTTKTISAHGLEYLKISNFRRLQFIIRVKPD